MPHIRLHRLAEFEENGGARTSQEDIDLLRLEQNTWGLLQAVMPWVLLGYCQFMFPQN